MPNYTRSKSSVETELYLRVFGKKLRNIICFSLRLGLIFFGLGLKKAISFLFAILE